jgi:Skp family chaperone for outer membrane proteins
MAVVDHQYALTQVGHGQAAQAQLRERFQSRHEELERRTQALVTAHQELEQRRAAGTDVTAAQTQYAHDHVRLETDLRAFQAEVAEADQAVSSEIVQRLATVVQDLARDRHLDLVVDRGIVAVASDRVVDITEDVVRSYNERYPDAAPAATEAPATPAAAEQPAAPAP